MKKILTILFVASLGSLQAQDDTTSTKRLISHEVGVNVTSLMKQVVSLSNTNLVVQPYNLTYKAIYKNYALRSGIGMVISNSSTSIQGVAVPRVTNAHGLSYRVGLEYQTRIAKRLSVYGGIDFVSDKISSETKTFNESVSFSGTTTTEMLTKNMSKSYGCGPALGIQFWINKRISIFTEAPLYFKSTTSTEAVNTKTTTSSMSGSGVAVVSQEEEDIQTVKRSDFSIGIPVTLYLSIKF
jgi:hypothetical protein